MSIILEISVIPQSGKNEFFFDENEILKFYLKSAPEKGKANKELIETLSKLLKIPQYKIYIISGAVSRRKRIKIDTELSKEIMLEMLYRNITRK